MAELVFGMYRVGILKWLPGITRSLGILQTLQANDLIKFTTLLNSMVQDKI
jgi:hypothetical protein